MSENKAKIAKALSECERNIREVIAAAAQSGDYDAVEFGRTAALQVQSIQLPETHTLSKARDASPEAPRRTTPGTKRTKKNTLKKSSNYPRFEIVGDNLLRFGWSKKEKREYSHKVPKSAFDSVISVLKEVAGMGAGPHTAESIIEKVNGQTEDEIPNYQVYAILGFLRLKELIDQQGREGYLIPKDFAACSTGCWA